MFHRLTTVLATVSVAALSGCVEHGRNLAPAATAVPAAAAAVPLSQVTAWGPDETVAFVNGRWFDGQAFVGVDRVVRKGTIVGFGVPVDRTIDLGGAFVIPPLADAHTHNFDGLFGFARDNGNNLRDGVFYVMTLTAPASTVAQIRHRFDDWDSVDVATSLGGLTGPNSHPAEIYEAAALGLFSYDQQAANQPKIRASTQRLNDAYYVVSDTEGFESAWVSLRKMHPDIVKLFLRNSERFGQPRHGWSAGGLDPALVPAMIDRIHKDGYRVVVANSSVHDFRLSLTAGADAISHLPCYQSEGQTLAPDNLYYDEETDEDCRLSADDAARAASQRMTSVLITTEWDKPQHPRSLNWQRWNVRHLLDARAPLAIGSDAYGATVLDGLVAEGNRGWFDKPRLLKIATIDTARLIFPDRALGCLEPGCEADFLVLASDPLQDFAALRGIVVRVKHGRLLEVPKQEAK